MGLNKPGIVFRACLFKNANNIRIKTYFCFFFMPNALK
jgi:hypothetical protein